MPQQHATQFRTPSINIEYLQSQSKLAQQKSKNTKNQESKLGQSTQIVEQKGKWKKRRGPSSGDVIDLAFN